MTRRNNLALILIVTVLMTGAVTMTGCRERSESGDIPDSETVLPQDGSDTETVGDDEATEPDSPDDPAADDDAISDSELAALAAELEAMESQLDALVFPDDDFSDIEELLD